MRRNGRIVGGLINGRNGKLNGRGGLLNARSSASSLPTYGLAAHFDAVAGITSASGFASQWNDLSGNARHLLQASGANQPIHLPAGTITSGTAAAGSGATTLNLAASALAVNDVYNDMTVTITGGTGSGQVRTITDYVGATKIATVAAWSVTPDNTSTYTITATRSSVFFDGAAHFMKCSAFTLNQPATFYLVLNQVTWTLTDHIFDGNTGDSLTLYQNPTTPSVRLYGGTNTSVNNDLIVNTKSALCVVANGASSSIQVNSSASTGGSCGAQNAGGFTLGASGSGVGAFANIQAYEALIYNVAHDAATRANVIRALMNKWGVA